MIDIRKLKELVRLMVSNELTELDLRDSEQQVTLRRGSSLGLAPATPVVVAAPPAPEAAPGSSASSAETPATDLPTITSPMVGTFYSAPNPDSPPYVGVGASIGPDTAVCVIEAMKIFNEIKAECSGTIERVLVKNGDPVEFGQPLFAVKPG